MMTKITFYLSFALFFAPQVLLTQTAMFVSQTFPTASKISFFNELNGDDLAAFEITTNLNALYSDRRLQAYHPSFITIKFPNGDTLQQQAKAKTRGKFRCKNCDYPPLKIKFPKKSLAERNFKKWNKYKLVYPCKVGENFQNYTYKEYLTYKIYNLLTDKSYRVELIDLTIKDSMEIVAPIKVKGFVLEDKEELVKRLNLNKNRLKNIPPAQLSDAEYNTFQVFQYMIGNTDWIPSIGHNMDMFQAKSGEIYPIPFDFDFSGFVRAFYAVPNSNFPIETVSDRYFMAHEKSLEELTPAFELFIAKKEAIFQLIKDFEYLPNVEKTEMIRFLKGFYKTIENPKKRNVAFSHVLPKSVQAFY